MCSRVGLGAFSLQPVGLIERWIANSASRNEILNVAYETKSHTLSKLLQWRRARTILASVRRVNQVLLSEILSSAQD